MVGLIDTHSHVYSDKFANDREQMLENAKQQGVERIYMPNVDEESVEGMLELAELYPGFCIPMMGLHPCSVDENYSTVLARLLGLFEKHSFAAVGEIGIDLYWDKTTLDIQRNAFIQQVEFALSINKPIVIHSRDATEEIVQVLRNYKGVRGVFHCFSQSFEFTEEILDMGFYLGIGGVLTYPKSGLAEAIVNVPLDRIVLETDAPYLAPVPFRGKRNEPAFVWHVAKKMAEVKEISIGEVMKITGENALKLFS